MVSININDYLTRAETVPLDGKYLIAQTRDDGITGTQHLSYTLSADSDYSEGIQMRLDKSTSTVTISNFVLSESSKVTPTTIK